MSDRSDPTGSVFLSYASQDSEAAARICEALRAADVDVWLDKSALHGGDAWDAQIKKRIHDCALFIPVISAHTNARSEGYFRGEWNLATRRLLNMAQDAAFLVPVVVDGTREADARVPDEFLLAQWTWLPNGETPPAFARRVRQLLECEPVVVHHARSGEGGKSEPSMRREHSTGSWDRARRAEFRCWPCCWPWVRVRSGITSVLATFLPWHRHASRMEQAWLPRAISQSRFCRS